MKFFVDTADIEQIKDLIPTGFVNGVTTNPSLIAKQGTNITETIKTIENDTNRDNFMAAEDALKYGLIDQIVKTR